MIMVSVASSNVLAVGHDAETDRLFVEFKNGASWIYNGITAEMHKALMAAESIGSHLRKVLIPAATMATKVSG